MTPRRRYFLLSTVIDFLFLCAGFLLFTWIFPGTLTRLIPELWRPFFALAMTWLLVSLLSGKYLDLHVKTLTQIFISLIINGITMFLVTTLLLLFLAVNKKTYFIAIGTGLFTVFFEFIWYTWVYSRIRYIREKGVPNILKPVLYPEMLDDNQEGQELAVRTQKKVLLDDLDRISPFPPLGNANDSIGPVLRNKYLKDDPEIFAFLESVLPFDCIHQRLSQVVNTRTLLNIQDVEEDSQQLVVNFHRLNDIRRINEFLIQVNLNLKPGGWFVCNALTQEDRKAEYMLRFPFPFNRVFNFMDFLLHRVAPKLPFTKEIYFTITRGSSRVISRAEILGRLYYCGFEKVGRIYSGGHYYVVAQKLYTHSRDLKPSYGPFIKLNRVGKDGRIIQVFKFRTMYPFSEYIQEYVHRTQELDDSGKFRNDFRITGWGRLLRRTWIDELPQLLNLYRGQIKLVGVRAISFHYYNLYPQDLRELRIKTKPGLIPPYFRDRPKDFKEICESEKRYLEAYLQNPLKTDWRYFWGAMYNIVIKKARSS